MAAIRSKGNKDTELRLAAMFRAGGITGWRRHQRLPGRPDFVFRRERLAVFVDGCFWHSCPYHGRKPSSRQNYWLPKLARNKMRDRIVTRQLRKLGWSVLRIWHHELANEPRVVQRCSIVLSQYAGGVAAAAKRSAASRSAKQYRSGRPTTRSSRQ
jgi:DNA mismatch endonuclease, patch repair protein